MHVEPGIVNGAKMALSFATAAGAGTYALKLAFDGLKDKGIASLASRTLLAMASTFTFFQVLPHFPVGVSEVHFILGSTLFFFFFVAPAAFGLALGLLLQGMLFAPTDLPMYFVNVTTLLVPLFVVSKKKKKIIAPNTAYVDLTYKQALKLSTAYQAGIVSWVAFWVLYGQGFGAEVLASVGSFGLAYMMVILIEPIADLAILKLAKTARGLEGSGLVNQRVYQA